MDPPHIVIYLAELGRNFSEEFVFVTRGERLEDWGTGGRVG